MWIRWNPNEKRQTGNDCTVRAICKLTGEDWMTAYLGICIAGAMLQDMPSTNAVWGSWLRERGYVRRALPDNCPDCYTVQDFCREHPEGKFLLMLPGHVVAVEDGNYYDTWDSGQETAIYYWEEST